MLLGTRSRFSLGQRLELTFRVLPTTPEYSVRGRVVRIGRVKPDQADVYPRRIAIEFETQFLALVPEFPFGYGLTYSEFEYSDLTLSAESMAADSTTGNASIQVSATIAHPGARAATEVVQLHVRDLVGSRTRPIRELKGFEKITLAPGESARVAFTLEAKQLRFHDGERWVLEPGRFDVWVAPDAAAGLKGSFEIP